MTIAMTSTTTPASRSSVDLRPWLLVAPTLIVMTVVGAYPLIYSLWVSFTGLQPTNPSAEQGFVFFANYADAFRNAQFWNAIGTTALFTVLSVIVSLTFGFLLALLFNMDLPGFVPIRTVVLVPMLMTPIAVGIVWRVMFLPDAGILNRILESLGFSGLEWTGAKRTALASVLLVDIWQWTPFMFLILFAGIRSLPKSPFEAAQIDGATPVQILLRVTVPLMRPVILIAVLLRSIDAIRTYDQVFILTRGGPDQATDLISLYIQRINFKFFQVGYGAAVSWLLVLAVLGLAVAFVRVTGFSRQFEEEGR